MQNKRLLSIDILRGIAIVGLILIHRIHYNWSGMRTHESLKGYMEGPMLALIIFFILLLSMAGIFYFMTGMVNAYSMQKRVMSGKSSWSKAMFFGMAGGFWIFVMNYVQRIFFMNGFLTGENGDAPVYPAGLITGWIRNTEQVSFYWKQVTEPGTLSVIGLLVMIISIVLGLLLKYRHKLNLNKTHLVLVILAVVSLLITPLMRRHFLTVYDYYFERGEYFMAALAGHVSKDYSLFPYLGYGFIGAAIGISLAVGEDRKVRWKKGLFTAIGLFVMAGIVPIIFDKEHFPGKGTFGASATLVELGLFILFVLWLLRTFDYVDEEVHERRKQNSKGIRRFGLVALTVFMLEPVLAEILNHMVVGIMGPSWSDNLLFVFLFSLLCLFVWHLLLKLWAKIHFAGSLEWLTGVVMLKLIKKKTGKTNFGNL